MFIYMNNVPMYDFIVIGGGVSGLYCAMELSKSHDVLLLEASGRLGGRIYTHENPSYEIGAGRLHASHKYLLSLLKRFHLHTLPLAKRMDHINQNDGYVPHVDVYIDEMIQKTTKTLTEEMRQLTFEEHCLSILGKEDTTRLKQACGYAGDFKMNAHDTIRMLRREKKGGFFVVREGLSTLIHRMIEDTHASIQLNHTVKEISCDQGIYHVDGYHAKKIIVALPAQALQAIPFLNAPIFNTVTTIPLIRIYAKYPSPVWFEGLPHMTTTFVSGHIIPIRDGVIMIAYTEKVETFLRNGHLLPKKEIQKMIKEELKTMFPFLSIPAPEWIETYLWEVGYHAWKKGAVSDQIQKEINHLSPGLFFCGEAYSDIQGWVEGALESAHKVVLQTKS
jgi:monoamine oxidase